MNAQPNMPALRPEAAQAASQAEDQDKVSPACSEPPKRCLICGRIDGHNEGCPGIEAYYEIFLKVKEWEKSISKPPWLDMVVCPPCGWTGELRKLQHGRCPNCAAGNIGDPFRLLTLAEMIADEDQLCITINLSVFIRSILRLAGCNIDFVPAPYPTETEALRAAWLALPAEMRAEVFRAMRQKDPFTRLAADLLSACTPHD